MINEYKWCCIFKLYSIDQSTPSNSMRLSGGHWMYVANVHFSFYSQVFDIILEKRGKCIFKMLPGGICVSLVENIIVTIFIH